MGHFPSLYEFELSFSDARMVMCYEQELVSLGHGDKNSVEMASLAINHFSKSATLTWQKIFMNRGLIISRPCEKRMT